MTLLTVSNICSHIKIFILFHTGAAIQEGSPRSDDTGALQKHDTGNKGKLLICCIFLCCMFLIYIFTHHCSVLLIACANHLDQEGSERAEERNKGELIDLYYHIFLIFF